MALRNPAIATATGNTKVAAHESIPAALATQITRQVPAWTAERLADCNYTRDRSSTFPDCKFEFEVFAPTGNVVVKGREFIDHHSFFWDA